MWWEYSKSKREMWGNMAESNGPGNGNTEYGNTLAETEGPKEDGNDRDCMCRGEGSMWCRKKGG
jgi:hypothetical protein